jgi:putative acetyltransferase
MNIRIGTPEDLEEMKQLYVDTIHTICNKQYNEEQLAVWSSTAQNAERWQEMIATQYVIIAEIDRQMAGFATLKNENYIDFFYTHKDFQRKGVAQQLLDHIEEKARIQQSERLSSYVSMTARPFFEKNGFVVLKEQENIRNGVMLINYKMEKALS